MTFEVWTARRANNKYGPFSGAKVTPILLLAIQYLPDIMTMTGLERSSHMS